MWNFGQSDLINCGQHKDESLGERHCEEVGAAIDKNGMDIEAIKKAVHYQNGCLFVFYTWLPLGRCQKQKWKSPKGKITVKEE